MGALKGSKKVRGGAKHAGAKTSSNRSRSEENLEKKFLEGRKIFRKNDCDKIDGTRAAMEYPRLRLPGSNLTKPAAPPQGEHLSRQVNAREKIKSNLKGIGPSRKVSDIS